MPDDSTEYMLTTTDNPWNPWHNYDAWYAWDQAMGYNTPGYLAAITKSSIDLSDADQERAIQDAIDEIVSYNFLGVWRKISRETILETK
jgi:hypothetical protein